MNFACIQYYPGPLDQPNVLIKIYAVEFSKY